MLNTINANVSKVFGDTRVMAVVPLLSVCLGFVVGMNGGAALADDTLATSRNLTANLVSPLDARTQLGLPDARTAGPQSGIDGRIVATARALKNDPDLIFEYVRNTAQYEASFGLTKGAVGVELDRSGNAFDQAHLMVQLLRADDPDVAGDQATEARYVLGDVTLTGAEIDAWFGVTDAKAVCSILADGGIPASVNGGAPVNGSFDCSTLSGSVNQVVMLHLWVEAKIDGTWYAFDPSRKIYEWYPSQLASLKSDANFSGTSFLATAMTGASTAVLHGVPWVSNVNYSGIESSLKTLSGDILADLIAGHESSSIEEAVGGRSLKLQFDQPLRVSAVPGQTLVRKRWDGDIPDAYRTAVSIYAHGCGEAGFGNSQICNDFTYNTYADEIAGKRVMLGSMEDTSTTFANAPLRNKTDIHLFIDGEAVALLERQMYQLDTQYCLGQNGIKSIPMGSQVNLKISVDHAYAANSGSYGDRTYETILDPDAPAVIVTEFGERHRGIGFDAAGEQDEDWYYPAFVWARFSFDPDNVSDEVSTGPGSGGDKQRLQTVSTFLGQASNFRQLVNGLFEVRSTHHHSIGVAWGRTEEIMSSRAILTAPPEFEGCHTTVADSATSLDIVSSSSVNSVVSDAALEKRVRHLSFSMIAALEGLAAEQVSQSPIIINAQSRFDWALRELSSQKFFLIDSANFAAAQSNDVSELVSAAAPYVNDGQTVLVPEEKSLGPGPRRGNVIFTAHLDPKGFNRYIPINGPSNYRGGALVAFSDDGDAGYVVTAGAIGSKWFKGAGASEAQDDFDPTRMPDVLEEDYGLRSGLFDGVSLSNGAMTYQPEADITAGSGSFPYSLSFARKYQAGLSFSPGMAKGWTHNWDIRAEFGADGLAAMGSDNPVNAAAILATMIASESLLDTSGIDAGRLLSLQVTQNWWRKHAGQNMVTIVDGNASQRFYRQADGSFSPPAGARGSLVQTGQRTVKYDDRITSSVPDQDFQTGFYWYDGVSLAYTAPEGDVRTFGHYYWRGYPELEKYNKFNKFNNGMHLTSWSFPFGVQLSFQYNDDQKRLTKVSNDVGVSLDISYLVGQKIKVTSHDGRFAEADGGSVKLPDGVVRTYAFEDPDGIFYEDLQTGSNVPVRATRPAAGKFLTQVFAATDLAIPHLTIDYDEAWRVKAVTNKAGTAWSFHTAGSRGAIEDPDGVETVSYFDDRGRNVRSISPAGDVTVTRYNGIGLPIEEVSYTDWEPCPATADATKYDTKTVTAYDANWWKPERQEVWPAECVNAAPTASDKITTLTSYRTDYPLPATETNARGDDTTFDYVSVTQTDASGNVIASGKLIRTVTDPENGVTEFTFNDIGLPSKKRVKVNASEWMVTDYGYTNANLTSRTQDPSGINSVTSFGYDAAGNATTVTDPRSNTTTLEYDDRRRLTKVISPPLPVGDGVRPISQVIYDNDGKVDRTCVASENNPGDCEANPSKFDITHYDYTDTFKVSSVTDPENLVTSYYYDAHDRLQVMVDAEGRKTRHVYDLAGRETKIIKAWTVDDEGVGELDCDAMRANTATDPTVLQQCYQHYTYAGDKVTSVADANGNVTKYEYDGFGRLKTTYFPDDTAAVWTDNLKEVLGYDANGNVVSRRTRSGHVIKQTYDSMDRVLERFVPVPAISAPATFDEHLRRYRFSYDLAGRAVLESVFHYNDTLSEYQLLLDGGTVPQAVVAYQQTNHFDAAGRLTAKSEANDQIGVEKFPLTYAYDAAGNVIRIGYQDGGFHVGFDYDSNNRVTKAYETNTSGAVINVFASDIDYTAKSEVSSIVLGNGLTTAFDYKANGWLDQIAHKSVSSSLTQFDFVRNDVGQIETKSVTGSLAQANVHPALWVPENDRLGLGNYSPNALNQYQSIDGLTRSYDDNGNLIADTVGRKFQYTADNLLTRSYQDDNQLARYYYRADGTRRAANRFHTGTGVFTRYYYIGDQEIMETNSALPGGPDAIVVNRRYVRLPGSVDQVLAMLDYTGNCTSETVGYCTVYPHHDQLGSAVMLTDADGDKTDVFSYSPFGAPFADTGNATSSNGYPFRYTGQKLDPETGLYYYKARYYDPETGRFLQTDPIGYEDQMNLYAYVSNDPVNLTDSTGMCPMCVPIAVGVLRTGVRAGVRYAAGRALGGNTSMSSSTASSMVLGAASIAIVIVHNDASDASADDAAGDPVQDLIDRTTPGRKTKGKTRIQEATGGVDQANGDFDEIVDPDTVEDRGDGLRTGETADGRKVNVREESTDGRPTVEIQDGKKKIKIRYDE